MALLKKVSDAWQPSENPGLRIGDTIEVTDYESLVKGGMAVLVDATGNELELPGQVFSCPICFTSVSGLEDFHTHVSTHLQKNKKTMEEAIKKIEETSAPVPSVVPEVENLRASVKAEVEKQNAEQKAEDLKAKRMAALTKAREAKKAKIKEL